MSELTLEEQEKILILAEALIAEPENWIKGKWKCPVWEGGERKTDANGQKVFQYCIEGAVHQAAFDVLGEDRARELGAIGDESGETDRVGPEFYNSAGGWNLRGNTRNGKTMTARMGLDDIAYELYSRCRALEVNDDSVRAHEKVLTILRTKLSRVREAMSGKEKA